MLEEIQNLLISSFWMMLGIAAIFTLYLVISAVCLFAYNIYSSRVGPSKGYNSLKTVSFGDESSVVANRIASFSSVVAIFVLWALATGSTLLPFNLPKPFVGDTSFTYTATNAAGQTDVALPPDEFNRLAQSVLEQVNKAAERGVTPAVVTTASRRRFLRTVLFAKKIRNPVLSYDEIDPTIQPVLIGVA